MSRTFGSTLTCSSYLSSKAEAFTASSCLCDEAVFKGSNDLSEKEQLLRQAYIDLGRPDLAKCVDGSRKWMRLTNCLDGASDWKWFWWTRRAFEAGQESESRVMAELTTEAEWRQDVIARNSDDPVLARLLKKYA
jgi:hypothetical protein